FQSTLGGLFKSAQKAVGGAANTVVREVDRHVSSENLEMFNNGNIVSLQSRETSRCLQVSSCGVLSANGLQHDKSGHFRVVNCGQNVVLLQSAIYPSWYIANHGGRIVGNGSGDPSCKFRLHETMNGFITLESVASPNQHVGVNADGEMKPADLVRKENSAMWVPTVVCGPQPIVHVEQTTVTRSVHSH
ncbi:uncharacterized protein LOC119735260, partial [Patiria miniata]|uniref:Uncharacterized protein n=1 Tax=Patiria miniata TaxID=46514 RepID=A0A914AN08_PATMI